MSRAQAFPPDWIDKSLARASLVLLACVVAALARGHGHWLEIPDVVRLHLATVLVALSLVPVMLLRRRGDRLHRALGWIWVLSLMATAMSTFGIRLIRPGSFSPIHLISLFVLIETPLIVWHAKNHQVRRHRIAVRATTAGALILAGFFTFPFGRLLGRWLFA